MRHPLKYPSVLALAGALALAAAGCGSSNKNDYVKQLNKAVASLQTSLSSATQDIGSAGTDGSAVAAKLESGGKAMDTAADNFDKIDPPSDAEHAHGEIVDGLHKLAGTFRDAAKSARSNHLEEVVKTLSAFQTSPGAQEIEKAQNELKDSGYKVAG